MNYKNITRENNPKLYTGGYKDVAYMAAFEDILSLSQPPNPPPLIGDACKIEGDHTFTDPKGWISWTSKTNGVTGTWKDVGDDGEKEIEYTYAVTIIGDDEYIQDMLQRVLNKHNIWILKEANCLEADKYIQLGDACVSPTYTLQGDAKTIKEGMKQQTISIITKARYFYYGALTLSTETEA